MHLSIKGRSVEQVGISMELVRKRMKKIKNLSHGFLSATRILLIPFFHVLLAEDLIRGGLALGLVSCSGFI